MNQKINLLDIVTADFQKEIQDSFAYATGLGVIFTDDQGTHIGTGSNFSSFCRKIHETEGGLRACRLSNYYATVMAMQKKRPYIYVCHAGLVDVEIPLIINNQLIGSIMAGQVLCTKMDLYKDNKIPVTRDWLADETLRQLYQRVKVYPQYRIEAAATALFNIGNYIVQNHATGLMRQQLAEKQQQLLAAENRQVEMNHQLKIAELDALQKQVNPHFIFNTISSISRLISLKEYTKAEEMLNSFAKMLRYSLSSATMTISLQQEMDYITQYLSIQKHRFGDRIDFKIDIAEEMLALKIPFFALQPLVENALEHGISPLTQGGHLSIEGYKDGRYYVLKIIDDGCGMSEERLNEVNAILNAPAKKTDTSHVGIYNSYSRFKILFGDQFLFQIYSQKGRGTQIVISICK